MHNFFPSGRTKEGFVIEGEELRHLLVRRIRIGEEIGVIHEGKIFRCVLKSISKNRAVCGIIGTVKTWDPEVCVTLIQAVPQDLKTMDLIVRKVTEIGVSRLVLTITERSFQKEEIIEKKKERWLRIVREAMKQCGRPVSLQLEGPVPIDSVKVDEDVRLFLHRDESALPLSSVKVHKDMSFAVAVGPEGGFSEGDVSKLKGLGFTPVRINTYTMRSETAAIVATGFIVTLGGP